VGGEVNGGGEDGEGSKKKGRKMYVYENARREKKAEG